MLKEFWDYFSTPSTPKARKEGYLYQSIALSHRARRCEKYWGPHLRHCRQEIEHRIQDQTGHVGVLGSGLLLETPIDLLEKYFSEVTFIDIVHPKMARLQVEGKKHIHLLELDLTEALPELSFDYVISANLLSQLPLLKCQKMLKQKISDEQISQAAFQIQKKHLDDLKRITKKGLLFSDFQVRLLNQEGGLDEENLTVDPRLKIKWEKTWPWDLAPAPELEKKRSVQLTVGICSLP